MSGPQLHDESIEQRLRAALRARAQTRRPGRPAARRAPGQDPPGTHPGPPRRRHPVRPGRRRNRRTARPHGPAAGGTCRSGQNPVGLAKPSADRRHVGPVTPTRPLAARAGRPDAVRRRDVPITRRGFRRGARHRSAECFLRAGGLPPRRHQPLTHARAVIGGC
jgi:hypothetical protein